MNFGKTFCKSDKHKYPIRTVRDQCPLCTALETIGILEKENKDLSSKLNNLKNMIEGKIKIINQLSSDQVEQDSMIRTLQDYIISLENRLKE